MHFNRFIRNKVQKVRGRGRGPNQKSREAGYKELRVALQVSTWRLSCYHSSGRTC